MSDNWRAELPNESILSEVDIPQLSPRQDSTHDQLLDLLDVANQLGMYDASDLIAKTFLKDTEENES